MGFPEEIKDDCNCRLKILQLIYRKIRPISIPFSPPTQIICELKNLINPYSPVVKCELCEADIDDGTTLQTTNVSTDQVHIYKSTQPTEGQTLTSSTCSNAAALESSLFYAVANGIIDVIKVLLRKGVNVNIYTKTGFTALHLAVLFTSKGGAFPPSSQDFVKSKTMIEILLIGGANVEAKSNCGFTPLHFAVLLERADAVLIFLENGANSQLPVQYHKGKRYLADEQFYNFRWWEKKFQTTVLHVAVKKRRTKIINMLLKREAHINAVDSDGKTPLMAALESTSWKTKLIYNILMDNGADGSITDTNGMNALHYAIKRDKTLVAKDLVKRGVPVNTPDNYGRTPLMCAIEREHETLVDILLTNNADPDYRNKVGMTPFHIACQHLNVRIVKLLLNAGADINLTCYLGMTPYDAAVFAVVKETVPLRALKMSSRTLCLFQSDGQSLYDRIMIERQDNVPLNILHSHVNMMDCFGIKLHKSHEGNLVSRVSTPVYSKNVSRIVEPFKRRMVAYNLSVNQLIHMRDPVYVLNEDVMLKLKNLLDELKTNEQGENIRNVMSYVIRKAKLKLRLLDVGQNQLMEIFKKVGNSLPLLPVEMCRNILSYLEEEDIKQTMELL